MVVGERVEHWFNRRYGRARRDVYLIRTGTGWQVLGRQGGADGQEALHYYDREDQARAMLTRMMETVQYDEADFALMPSPKSRPR